MRKKARMDAMHLLAVHKHGTEVALNTVLKEATDMLQSDLIAVRIADESDEAVLMRAQVKLGRHPYFRGLRTPKC